MLERKTLHTIGITKERLSLDFLLQNPPGCLLKCRSVGSTEPEYARISGNLHVETIQDILLQVNVKNTNLG